MIYKEIYSSPQISEDSNFFSDMILKNNKPIAILMATYNGERYLREQIYSIISQSSKDWALYIRDDGSRDGTMGIIAEYAEKYPNVVWVRDSEAGLGCNGNFLRLLEVVESKYYMFCDQDDVWVENKMELSLTSIQKEETLHKEMPILMFSDQAVCEQNLNVMTTSQWKKSHINPWLFSSYNYVCVNCIIAGANTIFNCQAKNLIFPLVANELYYDHWIAISVSKHGWIGVIDRPLRYYRLHEEQVLGTSLDSSLKRFSGVKTIISQLEYYQNDIRMLKAVGYKPGCKFYLYKFLSYLVRISMVYRMLMR